jgi:hypothetical protein
VALQNVTLVNVTGHRQHPGESRQRWSVAVGLEGERAGCSAGPLDGGDGGDGGGGSSNSSSSSSSSSSNNNSNNSSNCSWNSSFAAPPPRANDVWYALRLAVPGGAAALAPGSNATFALDLGSMGKGAAWVNGEHVGRYWLVRATSNATVGGCRPELCGYNGTFNPYSSKPFTNGTCRTGCGEPTQQLYQVPADWLLPLAAEGEAAGVAPSASVVLFEETGGDPSRVRLVQVTS